MGSNSRTLRIFNFLHDDLMSGPSAVTRYRLASKFGTLAIMISRKSRVQLVDLRKVCCKRNLFSAPSRQLMSVVEGREVFICELVEKDPPCDFRANSLTFFSTEHIHDIMNYTSRAAPG